jgi:methylglutaconyl-CoA hydratase
MLDIEKKENYAIIKMNRPEVHNAFNDELINKMVKAFNELETDDSVRLVVLTGEGKSFSAGADLNWMKSMVNYSLEENKKDSENLHSLFETINNFKKPVLGKINGAALGGGVGLVSVCDFALTHDKAKFGFTEVRLGLIPAVISPFVINKIGESNARAWFLSGERFDAHQAKQMNLVHEVITVADFEKRFEEILSSFLSAGPIAATLAKNLVKNMKDNPDPKAFTTYEIAKVRVSEEGQEGMNAMLDKRKASWLK